jgi:hypothetical protein
MCPLKSDLPVAEVDLIVVHVAAPRCEGLYPEVAMIAAGRLDPAATLDALIKKFGGGTFYLAMVGGEPTGRSFSIVGESFVTVPGPRSDMITALIKKDAEDLVNEQTSLAERRTKDAEFRETVKATEDSLATSLGEIYHAVVHARFSMNEPVETAAHLAKALAATERGLETVMKRVQARPPSQFGFLSPAVVDIGAMLVGVCALAGGWLAGGRKPKAKANAEAAQSVSPGP